MSKLQDIKTAQLNARKNKVASVASLLTTVIGEAEMVGKNANREVTEAEVIKVSRTEGEIHEEFSKLPDASHVAIIFTGKVLEKGQSFSLGIIS